MTLKLTTIGALEDKLWEWAELSNYLYFIEIFILDEVMKDVKLWDAGGCKPHNGRSWFHLVAWYVKAY